MRTALTELLDLDLAEKEERGLVHTPSEIYNQVALWPDTCGRFRNNFDKIRSFLEAFQENGKINAICAGAGTSEFIGYCIESLIRRNLGIPTNVFSTPQIVASPYDIFINDYATLLISFARSGDSPESIGAVEIADLVSDKVHHFIITCNNEGKLLKSAAELKNSISITLDRRTNDQGLAMTASFSNMLLAGQMFSYINSFDEYSECFAGMIEGGKYLLDIAPDIIAEICRLDFDRAVFLGSGGNFGTARESHLKLQELTNGRVMCAYDTFPGLRHGPEAVIDENTVVVAFLSGDGYLRRYETDLLQELREKRIGRAVLAVCNRADDRVKALSDYVIEYDAGKRLNIRDDLTPPLYVIIGQLFGLFKSINLKIKPDSPSESGVINRVVKGVKVYNPLKYRSSGEFEVISES